MGESKERNVDDRVTDGGNEQHWLGVVAVGRLGVRRGPDQVDRVALEQYGEKEGYAPCYDDAYETRCKCSEYAVVAGENSSIEEKDGESGEG